MRKVAYVRVDGPHQVAGLVHPHRLGRAARRNLEGQGPAVPRRAQADAQSMERASRARRKIIYYRLEEKGLARSYCRLTIDD